MKTQEKKVTTSLQTNLHLLNRREAARSLGVSLRALDEFVARREIPFVRLSLTPASKRPRVLFRPADLELFAAKHVVPARQPSIAVT